MGKTIFCAVAVVLSCGIVCAQSEYKVLWNFGGSPGDGAIPASKLIVDATGNLYGTTVGGGSATAARCAGGGCGTVFRLSPNVDGSWTNTVLYSFCTDYQNSQCVDGAFPEAALVFDAAGNLYGTSQYGGDQPCGYDSRGCGTVFELSPPAAPGGAWTETTPYAFCSNRSNNNQCLDGAFPSSQLVLDKAGNLYGTAQSAGSSPTGQGGVVFQLSSASGQWSYAILHSFCSNGGKYCTDGQGPVAGVIFDRSGNLYGTTEFGGGAVGAGVVFRLSPNDNGWKETVLYSFQPPYAAGAGPSAAVALDPLGNLYGTTAAGGPRGLSGIGGVFVLSPKAGGSEYTFPFNSSDGSTPTAEVLIDSARHTLYGTTDFGGDGPGYGTVFAMTGKHQETVLYSFFGGDGRQPVAGLLEDSAGNLYGTTRFGGANDLGVVFEVTPSPQAASEPPHQRAILP